MRVVEHIITGQKHNNVSIDEIISSYDDFTGEISDCLINDSDNSRINSIEKCIYNYNKRINYMNNLAATDIINNFNENNLLTEYKNIYKEKNILLRTNRRYPITILTINGNMEIWRYVLRPKTKDDYQRLLELEGVTVIVPKDEYLGLSVLPTKMTVEAMLLTAYKAQQLSSYKLAEETLRNDFGLNVCTATILDVTNIIGRIAFKNECEKAEEAYDGFLKLKHNFRNNKDGVIYIETDGAMFNTRQRTDAGQSWRENKLGLVFSSDNIRSYVNHRNGEIYNKITKREYTSYIGECSEFKKFLFACALRNGYGQYKETVLLSDGAKWIKGIKDEFFCDAQHILDFYHLKEKIYDFSKLYFNRVEKYYKPWAEKICGLMRASKSKEAIKDIAKMQPKVSKMENHINLVSYLENNIDNIDYDSYRNKGYCIGSGAIEGANKNLLEKRLKQAGMRWNAASAQNLMTLKARKESNLWIQDVVIPVKQYYGMDNI
jgi:hypothetical protein